MKYAHRYHIIQQAIQGFITSKEGAQSINISIRHFKRLKKKVKKLGPKVLIYGNCGRTPHNAYSQEIQEKVINLYELKYTLKLGLKISHKVMQFGLILLEQFWRV